MQLDNLEQTKGILKNIIRNPKGPTMNHKSMEFKSNKT